MAAVVRPIFGAAREPVSVWFGKIGCAMDGVEPHLHAIVLGKTKSGKTFLMMSKARAYRAARIGVIALHRPREPWPSACVNWQTADPALFIQKFWRCQNVVAFIEMSDASVGKYNEAFWKCATEGRHNGIRCYFIGQRAPQIHPQIRDNCDGVYLFCCGFKAAKELADEKDDPALLKAAAMPKRWFYYKPNDFTPAKLMMLKV